MIYFAIPALVMLIEILKISQGLKRLFQLLSIIEHISFCLIY